MANESQNRLRAAPFQSDRRYFLNSPPVGWWKNAFAAGGLAIGLVVVLGGLLFGSIRNRASSRGPVAAVHATWNDNCEACHAPFTGQPASLFSSRERWHSFRCQTCHPGSTDDVSNYAPHHARAARQPEDCSTCHREHQGSEFAISRVPDSECTCCHGNLKDHYDGSGGPVWQNEIGRFVGGKNDSHPEFRAVSVKSEMPDRRTLKFSHAVHLTAGMNVRYVLAKVQPEYQEQYRRLGDPNAPLQLDCAACHALDAGRTDAPPWRWDALPGEAISLPRAAGDYFLPIVFEKHCLGCHDLRLTPLKSTEGVTTKEFDLPHRISPPALEKIIRQEIVSQVTGQKPQLLKKPLPKNDRLDPLPWAPPTDLDREVTDLATKAERLLFDLPYPGRQPIANGGYCLKCHDPEPDQRLTMPPANLKRTHIPTVWLEHAKFNHAAHRAMQCAECHDKRASADTNEREPLDLPGIGKCRQCHGPSTKNNGSQAGGARHDCVECHRYHNGDQPLQALGSAQRDPPADRRQPIEQFLLGAPK